MGEAGGNALGERALGEARGEGACLSHVAAGYVLACRSHGLHQNITSARRAYRLALVEILRGALCLRCIWEAILWGGSRASPPVACSPHGGTCHILSSWEESMTFMGEYREASLHYACLFARLHGSALCLCLCCRLSASLKHMPYWLASNASLNKRTCIMSRLCQRRCLNAALCIALLTAWR